MQSTPIPTSELVLPPPEPFESQDCYSFPSDFMLGVSGSAVQIEGAVADEGQTPVSTDVMYMLNSRNESGLVATENYYLYKQDID